MHKKIIAALLALLLAKAGLAEELGAKAFERCAACHALSPGGEGTGPNLHGLFGRHAGSVDGFRYSGPMKRSAIVWDQASLSNFLRDPQSAIPGNRMPFSGVSDEGELSALVAYLAKVLK
jgi:cytochrome c